ncbi:MAG: response regulator [Muribaculaceae bacterium]|nr:response regulator [Muribaculaceae bacterium]
MKLAKLFIALTILLLAQTVCASSVRVNSTGAGKGTLNLCALRDKYGFLWIGTTTGLACFDGNGMPVNGTPSGILRSTSNMRVTGIFEIGDDMWFATPNQLMKLDRANKTTYRLPIKTKYGVEISTQVNAICTTPDANDELWIASQGQGLFIYNTKTDELIQNTRQGAFFTDITTADDGYIYAAGINGEIHKYNPTGEYLSTCSIPDYTQNKIKISLERHPGGLWIASGGDIYSLDTTTGNIVHCTSTAAPISSIINYDDNRLILGTSSGIMEYDPKNGTMTQMEVAENGQHFKSNSTKVKINQLSKDSRSGGLLTVRQSDEIVELFILDNIYRFIPLTNNPDENNFVNALAIDNRRNGLWIGSDKGLYYYDLTADKFSVPSIPGLGSESITSITPAGEQVWIGTAMNGLFLHNPSTGQSQHFRHDENTPYSLLSDEIYNVFVTTQGTTYVLTHWGICQYNPERNEFNTLREVGQQTEVVSMAEYYDGSLWGATVKDGLLHRKPGETRLDKFDSPNLGNTPINKLMVSRNGKLWATTLSNGIYLYNKDKNDFEPYRLPILANKNILALQEDNNGVLWILTEESIIKIAQDGKIEANRRNMFPSIGLSQPFVVLENGDMVIGGNNGFQVFNPSIISPNHDVAAYPTTISFPSDEDGITTDELGLSILLYTTDKITLPFDHNSFTIHLAANHPSDMPAVTYDYKLEDVDKDWNIGNSQSEVTYNNLSPGTYHFIVRPSGYTDVASTALTIVVSPPWYMTMWAYIGYAVLLLLVAAGIWQWVKIKVRKHYNRRMESIKIQREREAWESKMRFFVDLVHEIRTPLMLISLPLEQLMKRFKTVVNDPDKLNDREYLNHELFSGKKYLNSMQTNLDYLLGITNELLDFRKVDNTTEQKLYLSHCNLNDLIDEISERFDEPMESEGKRLIVNTPQEKPVIADIDKAKTDRVLMNLIGNARKYCKSVTEIKLEEIDGNAVITISDDGPGIPAEDRRHIFDLYYQIKDDSVGATLGTGLGLAYARLIAEAHGGSITVESTSQGGAEFSLSIPLKARVSSNDPLREILENTHIADNNNRTAIAANTSDTCGDDTDATHGDNVNVLVVDDNKELLEMISDGLSAKYNIITACDGVDALDKLGDNEVDFIVSDVMMPRMNGVELLQKVKENINTSHIPFIILTAKTSRDSREEGMASGADIYLEKPFSIRSLILQIENIRRTRQYFYTRLRGTEPMTVINADMKEAIEENKLPELSKYDRDFLEHMEKLMAENMSDDQFSIDKLAEYMNMSRSSFYRKVKVLMGMTPVDYIKNYRLDAAAKLLRERVQVNEVVVSVGFTSPSYFAKCFKEKYGVLPRDYYTSEATRK